MEVSSGPNPAVRRIRIARLFCFSGFTSFNLLMKDAEGRNSAQQFIPIARELKLAQINLIGFLEFLKNIDIIVPCMQRQY